MFLTRLLELCLIYVLQISIHSRSQLLGPFPQKHAPSHYRISHSDVHDEYYQVYSRLMIGTYRDETGVAV